MSAVQTEILPDTEKAERHRDPELRAMSRILATLRELPPLAADRVLSYVSERHNETQRERVKAMRVVPSLNGERLYGAPPGSVLLADANGNPTRKPF